MQTKPITVADIFYSLTPREKRKALAVLRQVEQTPCERSGHKYKKVGQVTTSWFSPPLDKIICERCGATLPQ
jgi:hypothetical protein